MGGITGWIDWNRDLTTERETLQAMTGAIAHRGPDAEGGWLSRHAALGHRRLAVLDADGGGPPMAAPAGAEPAVVVTFAGQLRNVAELRVELTTRGHRLATRSDTEVLAHAYLEWGAALVTRLAGTFAFAIWDTARQELLLVRDRLGVQPLHYVDYGTGLLFGSEPKAIIANPLFIPELDEDGIAEIFAMPAAPTPGHGVYRGMREVRPGTTVRFSRTGATRVSRYWQLTSRRHTGDLATTAARVRELLEDIVTTQLAGDVPTGLVLSGDVGSAALAVLAANLAEGRGAGKINSFSAALPETEDRVRAIADQAGTVHLPVDLDEYPVRERIAALHTGDLPSWGEPDRALYLLCRGVSRHATVALSADSADEVFGGYRFVSRPEALAAGTFPWLVWNPLGPAGLLKPEIRAQVRLDEYLADRYTQARAEVPRLVGEPDRDRRIREVRYLVLTRWLPTLLNRTDRMGMAASVQLRLPYCDHRLVEYLWNVPVELLRAGGAEKGLLRAAVADLLPAELAERTAAPAPAVPDRGNYLALQSWMREVLADRSAPLFDLVDREVVRSLLDFGHPLPGPRTPGIAYLLHVNEWLSTYRVRVC